MYSNCWVTFHKITNEGLVRKTRISKYHVIMNDVYCSKVSENLFVKWILEKWINKAGMMEVHIQVYKPCIV